MSSHLRGCVGCGRHIWISEETCPFCGEVPSPEFRKPRERSPALGTVGRAAVVAAGTIVFSTAVLATSACTSSTTPEGSSGQTGSTTSSSSSAYGGPIDYDAFPGPAQDAGDAGDAADVNVSMGDAYGIPALDSGKD